MPLGDSLTWGYDGGPDNPTYLASLDTGGYRSPLYQDLTGAGVTVNYVGVSNENPSPILTAAGETAQDGFNGYRIDQISANLDGYEEVYSTISDYGGYWLTGGGGTGRGPQTANIILLQIGANDIGQEYDPLFTGTPGTETGAQLAADTATRLGNLITQIMKLEPDAMLLVDGTSPIIDNAFLYYTVEDYDTDVDNLISTQFENSNVHYVDMWDPIINDPNVTSVGQLYGGYDGVHLSAEGYALMAQTWDNAIIADFADIDPAPVPEPSTYALFAGGALALFAWRKFRRAS